MGFSRREALKAGAAIATGAGLAAVGLGSREARADGSWIKWGYSAVGIPEGNPGDKVPLGLSTADGNVVAVTTGDFTFTDSAGRGVEFVGKGASQDRASLILAEGPVGLSNGGAEVNPVVRAKYNWVGVTPKPNGSTRLDGNQLQELIDERVSSLRDPANKNGRDGGGLTGPVDVVVIDGQTGKIRETRVVYP